MIYYNKPQVTAIQYIMISKKYRTTAPFFPPTEFDNEVIGFLRQCPKDILQLGDALQYFEISTRSLLHAAYHFNVIYSENFNHYHSEINDKAIKVFFIDGQCDNLNELVDLLTSNSSVLRYHYIYNKTDKASTPDLPRKVSKPSEFITGIFNDQVEIFKELGVAVKDLYPDIACDYGNMIDFPLFKPAQNNLFILNSLVGNFCYYPGNAFANSNENDEMVIAERIKSVVEQRSFNRQDLITDQVKKIDFFSLVCYKEGLIRQVHRIDPYLSPLVLIAPFQNPDIKKIVIQSLEDQEQELLNAFITSLEYEQTENYVNNLHLNSVFQAFSHERLLKSKTNYLDDVAFLHSSNYTSPVIRLPFKGKSIYKNLSYFRSEALEVMSSPKNRRNINKTIVKFAKLLSAQVLSPELTVRLKKHNRQIIAISDLPLEWLDIDGMPLAFTHDLCRLPETPIQGLMASFVHNERLRYIVPKDIIKKTLVIYGCQEPAFKKWQAEVDALAEATGFHTRVCLDLKSVVSAVNEIKPDFLIFDCHGAVDVNSRSTYLQIGREKLTSEYIVNNNIQAPLIFLSACNTAPNYGTINSVANAFFENGAFSVTTTYLPININTGSILYLRVLNNLTYAANNPIHKNWLAFMAHMIRTSAIADAYSFISKTGFSSEESLKVAASQAMAFTTVLSFQERRRTYKEMDKTLLQLSGKAQHLFSNIIPEYLFYSNLGRSDLVLFESWKNAHHLVNEDLT